MLNISGLFIFRVVVPLQGCLYSWSIFVDLSVLYTEAAYLVCLVKGRVCRLKTGLYTHKFTYDLRKIYALASKTLNSYGNLLETLKRAGLQSKEKITHLSSTISNNADDFHSCRQCHLLVLIHDVLKGLKHPHHYLLTQLYESTEDVLAVKKLRHAHKLTEKCSKLKNEKNNVKKLLPCYARVNRLKTTLSKVVGELEKCGFEHIIYSRSETSYRKFRKKVRRLKCSQFMLDYHLPHILLVFPSGTALHQLDLYRSHCIVIQDKASCFSPEVLQPHPNADVLDACAAPGNKTLQLISMLSDKATVFAIDRDPTRFHHLCDNLISHGVNCVSVMDVSHSDVTKYHKNMKYSQPNVEAYCTDFLSINPYDPKFFNVQSILLDPSCSGSGLSFRQSDDDQLTDDRYHYKGGYDNDMYNEDYTSRLKRLSNFQAILLKHALNFPNVQRVVYSTCSIHPEENEAVVRENADRVSDKFYLETIWSDNLSNSVDSTTYSPIWKHRGLSEYQCESCLRSSEKDLTNGFFIALFVRRKTDSLLKILSSSTTTTTTTTTVDHSSPTIVTTDNIDQNEKKQTDDQEIFKFKNLDIIMQSEQEVSLETTTMLTVNENISKRKRRKLEKYLKNKEARRDARKAQKQRRKMRQQNPLEQEMFTVQTNNNSNKDILMRKSSNLMDNSLSRKALHHLPKMSESKCQTRVVIDCAYDHLMSFKGICKLANQISKCYAINRRAEHPVQLYITGLGPFKTSTNTNTNNNISNNDTTFEKNHSSAVKQLEMFPPRLYDKLKLSDCNNWDVNLCETDFTSMFSADEIVYLCAESEYLLPDRFDENSSSNISNDINVSNGSVQPKFSLNDVYVIGGLIDHNNFKGFCYQQAIERGYRTARLPLKEVDLLIQGRYVLSTVHVFQALCPVLSGTKTWMESLKLAIPPRKLISV
ncbi:unnamed protein product [Heterobilharzia americana]|nr:unnamed protein product [Heterobilharzia americana]